MKSKQFSIFKQGSKTYFYSSIFFPKNVRDDVFDLYAFVRIADDYVDQIPQDEKGYYAFKNDYRLAQKGEDVENEVVIAFVDLMNRKNFNPQWVEAFFDSMEWDMCKSTYDTINETTKYIYGSAEVIGLMMSRIMGLSEEAFSAAQALGKSMQYINFIRDLNEDLGLNRIYFPQTDLMTFGLSSLEEEYVRQNNDAFNAFYRKQVSRYKDWQEQAEKGFHYIPKRFRIPVKTASDLYLWTASQIEKDPMIVYSKQLKPSIPRILLTLMKNLFIA